MDEDLDGKVYWEEYWAWAKLQYGKKGWSDDKIQQYESSFKNGFNKVAGADGYITYADVLE